MNRAWVARAALGLLLIPLGHSLARGHEVTGQERISARTALSRIEWAHRIWPKENPTPKPVFETDTPASAIAARVVDEKALEVALSRRWNVVIGDDEVQAELNRIAESTKDPATLAEMFHALHDDPDLIAETLVRPLLVERRVRDLYARDPLIHAEVRSRAERALVELASQSSLEESDEAFYASSATPSENARWPKRDFDSWWAEQRLRYVDDRVLAPQGGAYELPAITATACSSDSWSTISGFVARARGGHTSVWTGTEMIVWGGDMAQATGPVRDGARYNPVTNVWKRVATNGAPSSRDHHTAVWTGTEMIVWGGANYPLNGDGASYDPSSDTWSPISALNAPSARYGHTAVWTGTEMIVWGGSNGSALGSGARYTPSTDSWTTTEQAGAPTPRSGHFAAWTGSRMIVWGSSIAPGGIYDPAGDTWAAMSTSGEPTNVYGCTVVWAGTRLLVWSGNASGNPVDTGARYDLASDTWSPMSTAGAPTARDGGTAIWTGTQMLVWGGEGHSSLLNDGARYAPGTDTWTPISTTGAPSIRFRHTALWTGSKLIVWGGQDYGALFASGGRYDPVGDTWAPTVENAPAPASRSLAGSVWTGTEMIVWGGVPTGMPNTLLANGGRYNPALDTWLPVAGANAPTARYLHTAVWTGTRMLVWGGFDLASNLGTGGGYRPSDNTWNVISTTNAPEARAGHVAVWTGSRMTVWGGQRLTGPLTHLNTGGRYDPATDLWTPTAAPASLAPRQESTAVWDGSRVIVWGGQTQSQSDPSVKTPYCGGNRYDPVADVWTNLPNPASPVPCYQHASVWSGSEMILWGHDFSSATVRGGRYRPATGQWLAMSLTGSPVARDGSSAAWSGDAMIVWGSGPGDMNDGGRYAPASDSWLATSMLDAVPAGRMNHIAASDGMAMTVWGGNFASGTGASYCACGSDVAIPGTGSVLTAGKSGANAQWSWTAPAAARAFDLLRGDLVALRMSEGNFTTSTRACAASRFSGPPVDDTQALSPGDASWFLVRAANCKGAGSYNDGTQAASRDAGIQASGVSCP